MNCPVCFDGQLEHRLVDKWMRQGEHWVLFRNVPALVCDLCGDTAFSQETTERLLTALHSHSPESRTREIFVPVYDLQLIDAAVIETPAIKWGNQVDAGPQNSSAVDHSQWRFFQSAAAPQTVQSGAATA